MNEPDLSGFEGLSGLRGSALRGRGKRQRGGRLPRDQDHGPFAPRPRRLPRLRRGPRADDGRPRLRCLRGGGAVPRPRFRPSPASRFPPGFTRRRGQKRKAFSQTVEGFAALALNRPRGEAERGSVALVFGNERTGLTEASSAFAPWPSTSPAPHRPGRPELELRKQALRPSRSSTSPRRDRSSVTRYATTRRVYAGRAALLRVDLPQGRGNDTRGQAKRREKHFGPTWT
jgi:hypothetical protein